MYRAFNMGLGIVVVAREASVDELKRRVPGLLVVGTVDNQEEGDPRVRID
jgi:phosphoribosylaminoimidazole (AIR) synthetase